MIPQQTRVLVAGAGALGSIFGGFLRGAGFDVTLLGRAPHMEAIATAGLDIDGIWGERHFDGLHTVTDCAALKDSFDAILLTVKSFDTSAVAKSVAPLLRPDGFAISLQNGLGNVESAESVFGGERTIGARVIFGAEIRAPGRAHVSVIADPNAVGSLDSRGDPRRERAALDWARCFDEAGVPSTYTDELPTRLWAKVLYNAALNPLGALLGVHYGALPERAESKAILDDAIEEAFAVAIADGAAFPWKTADDYRREFYQRLVPATYNISLQNGLGNVESAESVFGGERTIGARVIFGAEIRAPGRAHVSVIADPNAVGSLDSRGDPRRERAALDWARCFDEAGVPSTYTDELPTRLWAKVLYNAALNPLGALLGVHYGALPERAESKAILDDAIEEAFAVAIADGAAFPWKTADDYRREFYQRLVPATYNHRPSMLQDLESGRRTEIAAINGEVVRRGAQHGIATPVNQTLVRLVKLREQENSATDEHR